MKIEIEARLLRAALICVAKSDIRYALNGVAIEVHNDRALVLATDGHRLFVGRSSSVPVGMVGDEPLTYIVPRELVERALKALPNRKGGISSFGLQFTFNLSEHVSEVEIRALDATFGGALIDAKFPDWRRVAGVKRTSTDTAQFKPDYIADCQRVAECFASNKAFVGVDISHNGPTGVALVTFSTTADACVFLMPMRTFEAAEVKRWLLKETRTTWDIAAEKAKP
jgi:hypothetical protein